MKYALVALIAALLVPAVSLAQEDECALMVQEILSGVARSCQDTGPGEVCFGHGPITVTTSAATGAFGTASDTLALDTTCCVRLAPLQPPDEWGVAVMKVRPDAGEHSLTYVLLGEVEMSNAASFFSELEARVESDTAIYAGPGSHYATLAHVAAGDVLRVNACNCTKNWLRVRLASGEIGWIPARRVTVLGEVGSLPVAAQDTPVYAAMQAFTFRSGAGGPACASAPEAGILIYSPLEGGQTRLWINGAEVTVASTVFVQAEPGGEFTIAVLDGNATITVNDETVIAPPGVRVAIPLSDGYAPSGHMRVSPYALADVEHLPLALLPQEVDIAAAFGDPRPLIIGQKTCNVVSDRGETICALHFVNLDGDPITRLTTEFIYAAQGTWQGSDREFPAILEGDTFSGDLAWPVSCSLGGANFIGPVIWSVTMTDASGHVSPPFEASFNCVDG
ncbi:MAG: hypothetical protein HRF48_18455 [Chloroflexota bacterium]|jgi:hypothetical protein